MGRGTATTLPVPQRERRRRRCGAARARIVGAVAARVAGIPGSGRISPLPSGRRRDERAFGGLTLEASYATRSSWGDLRGGASGGTVEGRPRRSRIWATTGGSVMRASTRHPAVAPGALLDVRSRSCGGAVSPRGCGCAGPRGLARWSRAAVRVRERQPRCRARRRGSVCRGSRNDAAASCWFQNARSSSIEARA